MKIRYQRWRCAGCDNIERIPENTNPFYQPPWFNIRRIPDSSSQPSFDAFACSTECLKKTGDSIQKRIEDFRHFVPSRQDNQATICDQCGNIVIMDLLHPRYGGVKTPLDGWTWKETSKGHFDFCCPACEKDNLLKPEESLFFGFESYVSREKQSILKIIESENFREAFEALKNQPKKLFGFPKTQK